MSNPSRPNEAGGSNGLSGGWNPAGYMLYGCATDTSPRLPETASARDPNLDTEQAL